MKQKNQALLKGFTLIEVMMTMSIISFLSSAVINTANNARNLAHDANVKETLSSVRSHASLIYDNAGATYNAVCYTYPVNMILDDLQDKEGVLDANYDCVAGPQEWVTIFPLKAKLGYWCTDGLGSSKQVTGLLDANVPGAINCDHASRVVTTPPDNGGGGGGGGPTPDLVPPVVTLMGSNPYQLKTKRKSPFEAYHEPGFTAIDNVSGNITASVVVSGPAIIRKDGRGKCAASRFEFTYTARDAAGNIGSAKRTVILHPCIDDEDDHDDDDDDDD